MSGMLPGVPLPRGAAPAQTVLSPRPAAAAPAVQTSPVPPSSTSAPRFVGACCLLQAAVLAPIAKSLGRRRPRGAAAAAGRSSRAGDARNSSAVAASARRSQTEDRLKELETLVGDDEDLVSSIDDVAPDLQAAPAAAATTVRFRDLPQELPRAIPFLPEPSYRAFAANVPGDAGFDPLGVCKDVEQYINLRESELKHGRLAMIAALAWPLAETGALIVSEEDSAITGIPNLLADTGGRALPQLTGGLGDSFVEVFVAVTLLFGSAFELTNRRRGSEPGDVGFDPLKLRDYRAPPFIQSFIPRNRAWMAEAEVQHARAGMLAIAYDIIDELTTGNPVIEDTEYFFYQADAKLFEFENWLPFGNPTVPDSLLTGEFPSQI